MFFFNLIWFDSLETRNCFVGNMELISQTIQNIVSGRKVRIGYKGKLPVFSVGNVVNMVSGKEESNAYGGNFVNTVLKQKYPHLYALIIPFKFPASPRETPCMDMFGILKTLSVIQCSFTKTLNEIASTGILQAEAGDQGLLEYILCNASSNSPYQKLMRDILWADKNPEAALSGIGPADAQVIQFMLLCLYVFLSLMHYVQITSAEEEQGTGGCVMEDYHADDPPSDQEAALFIAKFSKGASVSGKKHHINLPDYSASKFAKVPEPSTCTFAKVPEPSSAGDVPAFYYDVYQRNTKDSNTFYEAFLRKDETERQDRLAKEKAERDERLRKEAQDKKENDEMREMLKGRIAELKEEKKELQDDVKRFFGVLEENKVLKQSLSDKESWLNSTQAQLRTATSDLNEQKGFYRELERDLLHVKQERDDLHASLATYEDRPLGLPIKNIARGAL